MIKILPDRCFLSIILNMKKLFLLVIILIPGFTWGIAKEGEELETLDNLIASTERQLLVHKELRTLVANFQTQQDKFHKGEQTKDLAVQMVQTATQISKIAEEHKLLYLFTPFFLEELKLFSGIGKKKSNDSLH